MKQSTKKGSRQKVEWFREAFAGDYLWLYAHRNEKEAAAQVQTVIRHVSFAEGQKILDIACGAGRHMLAFARHGARMTGIDLSRTLVKTARIRIKEEGLKAVVRLGDMRELDYQSRFDGATIWFTSLGYFAKETDDQKVLRGLAAALKPSGWWWIDLPNPVYLEVNLVSQSERTCRGPHGRAHVSEKRRIIGRRIVKKTLISDAAGIREYKESVRLYRPEQFGLMIHKTELRTDGILGDYGGSPLTKGSPRQIWYGRKGRP